MEYKWKALLVTTVGVLMAGINSRIVIIGLPVVSDALGADAIQAVWFTQGFALGSTATLLFIGRASDIYGRVRIYTLGFLLFTLASVLVGFSESADQFIVFRMVQGIAAASLFANSAAIITDATPLNRLGFALGINMVAFRLGAIASLTLSGFVLSLAMGDWRVLFFMSLPFGLIGAYLAKSKLREVRISTRQHIDWIGFVSFTGSISAFLVALSIATYGGAGYSGAVALGGLSLLGMAAFVIRSRRTASPLLDFSLLRIREFAGGTTAALLNTLSWGGVLLLISLYLQLVLGLSPLKAGLAILPFDFAFLTVGPLSGRLADKYGHIAFTTGGLIVTSVALVLFSTSGASTSYGYLAVGLVVFGVGTGLFSSPNSSSIMGSVPARSRGVASGFNATFINIGFTLSFNIAVLLLSFYMPYGLISNVISSSNSSALSQVDKALFSSGLDKVYLWLAAINTAAVFPSMLRGKRAVGPLSASEGASTTEA